MVLNLWYARLAENAADRTEFDRWLWSDPEREHAILRALG